MCGINNSEMIHEKFYGIKGLNYLKYKILRPFVGMAPQFKLVRQILSHLIANLAAMKNSHNVLHNIYSISTFKSY